MTRIHYSESLIEPNEIRLDQEASHHLTKVLRLKVSDQIQVFNQDVEYLAQIKLIEKRQVVLELIERIENHTESTLHTTLIQAVTRRERMDYAIQKATELGVNVIQPVISEHCVVKLDERKAAQKLRHWQGIAKHASQQSGRLQIPVIRPLVTLEKALSETTTEVRLIFAVSESRSLATVNTEEQSIQDCTLAIGPVGGFSATELEYAQAHQFQSIKLGPRILRAETACVAALTAIQLRWGDLA